MHYAEVVTWQ